MIQKLPFLLYVIALWGLSLGLSPQSFAVPAFDKVIILTQPDGSTFEAIQRGDEYANWMETAEGYSIVQSEGDWYYAVLDETGQLIPSTHAVNSRSRSFPVGIEPHLQPAPQVERPLRTPKNQRARLSKKTITTQKVLLIMVDFENQPFTYTPADFEDSFFGLTNSVRDYYLENSYGQFDISPAAETSGVDDDGVIYVYLEDEDHPNSGDSFSQAQNLAGKALDLSNSFINYSTFDTNNDNAITPDELSIVLIVAGYEAAFTDAPENNIWAHQYHVNPTKSLDGVALSKYAMFGEIHSDEGDLSGTYSGQATIGVMCHELAHLLLDLPDLYDTDGTSWGLGNWSLMAHGSWGRVTNLGDSPAFLDAWSRTRVGFATPVELTGPVSNDSLDFATSADDIRVMRTDKFQSPLSEEYFYLENRKQAGYDASLPGEGLVIYHVDEKVSTNSNELRKRVDIEAADGFNDLDDYDNGNAGDDGDVYPGSTSSRSFSQASSPDSSNNDLDDTDVVIAQIRLENDLIFLNATPGGDSLYDDDPSFEPQPIGFDDMSDWTAVEHTNTTQFDEIYGFEVYIRGTATVDFHLYESMNSAQPSNLIASQTGFDASSGWNRFLLSTPISFPLASTRVMVLEITNNIFPNPIRYVVDGDPGDSSWISDNGTTFTPFTVASNQPYDLLQHILLSHAAPMMSMDVYVDPAHTGDELGTSESPFCTITAALSYLMDSGTLHIAPELYVGETTMLNQPMTLETDGVGAVTLR